MILVTGATGLIGAHLLVALSQKEIPVRALFRTETNKQRTHHIFFNHIEGDLANAHQNWQHIEWHQADLLDLPKLQDAFEGITEVYHCAALISFDPARYRDLRKINIEGTANIVNLCLSSNVQKLSYLSSIATLDPAIPDTTIDESLSWNADEPHSAYAISKYGAELEVWRAAQEGLSVVILNPGVVIGPGSYDQGSGAMFKKIDNGLFFFTYGGTGFVGVWDVVRILIALMEGPFEHERYVVVAENSSYQAILQNIALHLGKKPPRFGVGKKTLRLWGYWSACTAIFGAPRPGSIKSIQALHNQSSYSSDKIKQTLAYSFESLDTVIAKTAKAYIENR